MVKPTFQNTALVMRSKRDPEIVTTFDTYAVPTDMKLIVVADPEVYDKWKRYLSLNLQYDGVDIDIVKGRRGLAPQAAACYEVAWKAKYDWLFRIDDDLKPKTFVHKNGAFPSLTTVIKQAMKCAIETRTSLVGFTNTSRRDWLGDGYGRTYGLIHGGAQLHISSATPEDFIDDLLPRFEDVYRSCSHRDHAGAVGRVKFIGLDKSKSSNAKTNQSVTVESKSSRRKAIAMILDRWPDFVTCANTKTIHGGKMVIPNFRFKRHMGYQA
jgi:hypothetical protein